MSLIPQADHAFDLVLPRCIPRSPHCVGSGDKSCIGGVTVNNIFVLVIPVLKVTCFQNQQQVVEHWFHQTRRYVSSEPGTAFLISEI